LVVIEACAGSETTRELREVHGRDGMPIPIIRVASNAGEATSEDYAAAAAEGLADLLVEPFSPSYARARIRAALIRRACRWQRAGKAKDESKRLAALRKLGILDTPPEERFDRLTRLAAALFDAPVALMTLVDAERQWFKSTCGLDVRETSRDESFCAHAILNRGPMVIRDALLDDRFAENPAVLGALRVRSYAGYPLTLADGSCVGTFCIADTRPREFDEASISLLRDLAQMALREMEKA
jgi:CheY-like chemotaxis protein